MTDKRVKVAQQNRPPRQGPRVLLAHCVSLDVKLLDSYVSCSEGQI